MSKTDEVKKTLKIENVVASTAIEQDIDLKKLNIALDESTYEPEKFPGLVYHIDRPRVVILLFGSGKLVIAGGKTTADAEAAVDRLVRELESLALI